MRNLPAKLIPAVKTAYAAMLLLVVLTAAASAEAPGFVGSQSCVSCHQQQASAWSQSHHSWALKLPSPQTMLGDFNDARFEHKGLSSRFFQKNGRYFVETDGPYGKAAVFEIKYAIGVAPLQQYLVELDGGRLQALDIAWDTTARRWFHLYPNDDVRAGNGLHWSGPYKNWQARCAVCHQTDFHKNFAPRPPGYNSQWSELSVGCEACHGPAEAHLAWAALAAGKVSTDPSKFSGVDAHGWQHPAATGKQAIEANMCGPCHSRRQALGPDSSPPQAPFGNHYALSTLEDRLYFPDGQQRDEVYVLGSFMQSKMFQKGVTCTNCHDPHSGQLVAAGNAVCTQCHNETGRAEFPSLKRKVFDAPSHHHHTPGTKGAECVSCHMPERNYMVVDGRRDHFFRVPDPLLSQKAGSPDACLSCHTGQKAAWAADAIKQWAPQRVSSTLAYGETLASARRDGLDGKMIEKLAAIARDASQPAIARATAVREMADQADGATAAALAPLLADNSELVREAAIRLWRSTSPAERVNRLQPLLGDPSASVRVAAALELANVPPGDLPVAQRTVLEAALTEMKAAMTANSDFPEGQLAIGGLALTTRNWDAARAAFAEAVLMDPQLVDAWLMRARIADALGDAAEATSILTSAFARNPGDSRIAMDLAAQLGRQRRDAAAVPILREAVAAHPGDQEVRIALAASLLRAGDLAAAQAEIDSLRTVSPNRAEVLVLAAMRQVLAGDLTGARATVKTISGLYPSLQLPPQLEALSRLP
ncbi:tetratricopeptide repeat protein [Mesorhizobium sp. ANAO-SY3R2]|uniref:tetratricopeptide repeat protein n=1 Tax=Mesorhizobium sp. ANAO-SY3R2 TaxID=3166644 RepID=UPI0036728230